MVVLSALYYLPGELSQLLAVFFGTLTALSDGMQYGWSSPISAILLSSTSPIPTTKDNIMFLEIIYLVGGICGIPFTIYMLNKIGRKYTMLASAIENLVAWIIIATSSSMMLLYVARFIAGFAADVNFVATPVYVSEISHKSIRGFLASLVYIMMVIGIVLIYLVGPYVSITSSALIGISILILQMLTFSFMPESPYYYLMKNRKEDARKSLQSFRSTTDVEEELNKMEEAINKENEERGNVLDLLRVKSNLKAMLIVTVLTTAQNFGGISVMFMNMHMILEEAASSLTENTVAILFSSAMLVSCIIAAILVDKCGRKLLLYMSSLATGAALLILAVYFSVKSRGVDVSYIKWLPIFAVVLYAFVYKYGIGLVPIVYISEIFPTNLKPYGVTYGDMVYVISGLLSVYLFYKLQMYVSIAAPFYLFAGYCMFTFIFTRFFVLETNGKTLEEIQSLLKGDAIVKDDNLVENNTNVNQQKERSYGTNL